MTRQGIEGRNPAVYLSGRRGSYTDGLVRYLDKETHAVIPGQLRAGTLLLIYLEGGGPILMALSAILSKRPMLWYLGNWGQEPCCLSTWQAAVLYWWPRPPSWRREPCCDNWVIEGRNPAVFIYLAGGGPMLMASSAILTKRPMLSATLCTATVLMPE